MCCTRLCFIGMRRSHLCISSQNSHQPWPPADQRLWIPLIQHNSFFIFVLPHFDPLRPAVLNPAWITYISISWKCPNYQPMHEPLDCKLLHAPPRTVAFTSLLTPNKKRQKKQAELTNANLSAPGSSMRVKQSSTQVLKAEYQAERELVQQELWCQRWNPLPSPRQFNKRETEAAKQLLTSVLKDTPWRQTSSRSSWIVLSTCGMERCLSPPPQPRKSCWQELSLDLSKWLLGYLPCPSFSKHHVTEVSPLLQA